MKIKTLILAFCLITFSCKSEKKESITTYEKTEEAKPNYIEITTRSMEFISPDTISSGWNTFKYNNLSNETHFFLMDKYPEGKIIDDTMKEVFPPFANGMDLINEGKSEEGFAEFDKLPEWFLV